MTTFIREATILDLAHVAHHLTDLDRMELAVSRETPIDAERLTLDAWKTTLHYAALTRDAEPAMVFGVDFNQPFTTTVWGFKTDRYREVILPVTKFIRRTMLPHLRDTIRVAEAQCVVHPDNQPSRKWLSVLGFSLKATLSGFGNRGEDMLLYARTA